MALIMTAKMFYHRSVPVTMSNDQSLLARGDGMLQGRMHPNLTSVLLFAYRLGLKSDTQG